MKRFTKILALLLALLLLFTACEIPELPTGNDDKGPSDDGSITIDDNSGIGTSASPVGTVCLLSDIPRYSGKAYVDVNGGEPNFTEADLVTESYETYGDLDKLGRCTVCISSIGFDLMPTEDRESISSVTPSGWINKKYDTSLVEGGYIYNRCHLIGFQLTGENAKKENLITGTRYLNIEGMLPFENMIASYVKETENHVLFRVTPVFDGDNLVASGVLMEAYSIEDEGDGICFSVFAYNVQPGIIIDYKTGDSVLSGEELPEAPAYEQGETLYVLNVSSKRVHRPECSGVADMAEHNKQETYELLSSLLSRGFKTCGTCNPE
ncbi:MAG: hypothetical protein E7657_06245 [Ruminococcaceae bacterium]|nr:hypothetical protein [Oscillospiraceae bacterium]